MYVHVYVHVYVSDCSSPPSTTGYIVTPGNDTGDLLENATAAVACDTGYSEDGGTPPKITCQANGTWVTPTGCTEIGMNVVFYSPFNFWCFP